MGVDGGGGARSSAGAAGWGSSRGCAGEGAGAPSSPGASKPHRGGRPNSPLRRAHSSETDARRFMTDFFFLPGAGGQPQSRVGTRLSALSVEQISSPAQGQVLSNKPAQ